MRTTNSRPYRMRRRAELVDETRRRITIATAGLHTTIGPGATTIAAIAEAAGVTRLTVYRHFPDLDELFTACQAYWVSQSRPPDPRSWLEETDLAARARRALGELYAWYGEHAEELSPIYRDFDSMPPAARERLRRGEAARAEGIAGPHAGDLAGRRLRAAAGHVAGYRTWRSLAVDQALAHDEAVGLAVAFVLAAAGAGVTTVDRQRSGPGA